MSDQATPPPAVTPPPDEHQRVEALAEETARRESSFTRVMNSSVGRNLGLVIALVVLIIIGVATAENGSPPSTTCSPSFASPR